MPQRAWRLAVMFFVEGYGTIAVLRPQIAHRSHFGILLILKPGDDAVEFGTAAADADVAERDAVVSAENPRVRQRSVAECGTADRDHCAILKKSSAIQFVFTHG